MVLYLLDLKYLFQKNMELFWAWDRYRKTYYNDLYQIYKMKAKFLPKEHLI